MFVLLQTVTIQVGPDMDKLLLGIARWIDTFITVETGVSGSDP